MWWELAVLVLAVVASYWIGRFSMMLNLMRELQQLEPEDRVQQLTTTHSSSSW